jgi:hypothetical protein
MVCVDVFRFFLQFIIRKKEKVYAYVEETIEAHPRGAYNNQPVSNVINYWAWACHKPNGYFLPDHNLFGSRSDPVVKPSLLSFPQPPPLHLSLSAPMEAPPPPAIPREAWESCSVLLDINDGDRLAFFRLTPAAYSPSPPSFPAPSLSLLDPLTRLLLRFCGLAAER